MVTYGEEEIALSHGYLWSTPAAVTGNICMAQLILTPNDVGGEFAMVGISDAIQLNFNGLRSEMTGIRRVKINPISYLDQLSLTFTHGDFLKNMDFQFFNNEGSNPSNEGEAIIRFGEGNIAVSFYLKHADGTTSKGSYVGEIGQYDYD